MTQEIYPLVFEPICRDYVWGGNRIAALYGRPWRDGICAESWEIADRPEGESVVRNGPLAGSTLRELLARFGPALSGLPAPPARFPLLVKLIDARETLSVQVHPDDETARRRGGEAKTEMWYVLDAAPGACFYCGLEPGADRSAVERALAEQRIEDVLTRIPAVPGESVFVPGGAPHTIGAGCLLLEVQQSSATTYRMYDWERAGQDGQPRELHVSQALDAIDWHGGSAGAVPAAPPTGDSNPRRVLAACRHFKVERIDLATDETVSADGTTFQAYFAAAGAVMVSGGGESQALVPGTTCLVPAATAHTLTPDGCTAEVIRITRGR